MFRKLPWRKVGGFSLLQLFGAIVPLFVLPILTRIVGAEGWVAIAIGYSMGGVVAILINFGWSLRGPGIVASEPEKIASNVYWESNTFRFLLFAPASLCGGALATILSTPEYGLLAFAMTIAIGANGLSPAWFFIGRGRPGMIALTDVGPKVIASLTAIPLLLITGQALLYPIALITAAVLGVCIANKKILKQLWRPWPEWRVLGAHGRAQYGVVLSGLIVAGYGAFSVSLTSIAAGGAVAVVASFAAAVRLRGMAQAGISAFSSGFQNWAIEKVEGHFSPRKMWASLAVNSAVGGVVGGVFIILAPEATPIVFGPEVQISLMVAVWSGCACVCYSISASLSYHILAPTGHLRAIAVSTIAASAVGVPLLLLMPPRFGAEGAAFAVMAAELVVVCVQLPRALFVLRGLARL